MTREEFAERAAKEVLLLDGSTGSMLYKMGMPRGVCTELWCLEHPDTLKDLQLQYAEAGTQILYAPTFSANRDTLTGFGLEDRIVDINAGLVEMTRRHMEGTGVLVAGDITTTGKALAPAGDMTYERLLEIYKEQVRILADAGADLLVAETMLNVDETMAVVDAVMEVCDLPIMCTLSLNADGTGIYGGSGVEAVETLQAMGASAVGLNCSVGPDNLEAVVRSMKKVAEVPVIAKPNAGMPVINARGQAIYSMGPEEFADHMMVLIENGAGIVGGCCGTSPDFIRALARRLGR